MARDWFNALGHPVAEVGRQACVELLVSEGCDREESEITVAIVAREIEHDQPARALKIMRTLCGDNETFVIRAVAVLCATEDEVVIDSIPDSLLVTFIVSLDGEQLHPMDSIIARVRLAGGTGEPDYDELLDKVNDAVIAKLDSLKVRR